MNFSWLNISVLSTLLFVVTFNLQANTIRLSEPVVSDKFSETFGSELDPNALKVSLAELTQDSTQFMGKKVLVQTRIAKVCQKKGCFFIAQHNEHTMRVSFKDYGFFIPTDASGKTVVLAGELIEKEMSKKQAAHFAADLKVDASEVKPGIVYELVAESIKIPLS